MLQPRDNKLLRFRLRDQPRVERSASRALGQPALNPKLVLRFHRLTSPSAITSMAARPPLAGHDTHSCNLSEVGFPVDSVAEHLPPEVGDARFQAFAEALGDPDRGLIRRGDEANDVVSLPDPRYGPATDPTSAVRSTWVLGKFNKLYTRECTLL